MEAEIPASHVKLFQRALTLLHKVGELVTLETSQERLVLRALSRTESAYAQIGFAPTFFTRYAHSTTAPEPDTRRSSTLSSSFDEDEGARQGRRAWGGAPTARSPSPTSSQPPSSALPRYHTVQINSRMLLVPFRGSMSAAKRITLRLCPADELGYGEIEGQGGVGRRVVDPQPTRKRKKGGDTRVELDKDLCLMVQLHLEDHAVVRTFRLPTLEQANVLQPNFSRQSCPTQIGAKASKFSIWLQNFPESAPTPLPSPSLRHPFLPLLPMTVADVAVLLSSLVCSVEELSLTCGRPTVRFRSFLDWATVNSAESLDAQVTAALAGAVPTKTKAKALKIRSFVQTESVVSSDDFSLYNLSDSCAEQAMVFTLPEVRHFAQLCEESDEELYVFAVAPGQPVLLTNTRTPLLTSQQRATRQARQAEREQPQMVEGGTEEYVAPTLAPSPTSIAESQYSFNTAVAEEQRHRTWSGELILATLAPEAALLPSQESQSQPTRQEQVRGAERRPSPSPPPAPHATRQADGAGRASPALSPSFDV